MKRTAMRLKLPADWQKKLEYFLKIRLQPHRFHKDMEYSALVDKWKPVGSLSKDEQDFNYLVGMIVGWKTGQPIFLTPSLRRKLNEFIGARMWRYEDNEETLEWCVLSKISKRPDWFTEEERLFQDAFIEEIGFTWKHRSDSY